MSEVRNRSGRRTGRNIQLGAAGEQTKLAISENTLQSTGKQALGLHDGVARLLDLVAAAQLHVLAASVAGNADGDIVTRLGVGAAGLRRRGSESAEGEGEDGSDGETHFDGWFGGWEGLNC